MATKRTAPRPHGTRWEPSKSYSPGSKENSSGIVGHKGPSSGPDGVNVINGKNPNVGSSPSQTQ